MKNIKYRIEFLDEDGSLKTSMIYDHRLENKNMVIIEAENNINPTNYTEIIYDLLKLNNDIVVILDLSNLYGVSQDSLYQWVFITEGQELVDEDFIPISKINWLKEEYKENNNLFKSYFLNKTRKFSKIVVV